MPNEIISLQAGTLANRVFVHYWKYLEHQLQNDCANISPFLHELVFETDVRSTCFSPRLLSIDLRDNIDFGLELGQSANFEISNPSYWGGRLDTIVQETNTESWLKCLSFNSRNKWTKNNILMKLPSNLEFNALDNNHPLDHVSSFSQGLEALCPGTYFADEFDDRIRILAERCSCPDVFQLFVDAESGFSGVGSRIIEYLSYEFPKRSILTVPVYNSHVSKLLENRRLKISGVNQLSLINTLESSDYSSYSSWMPLDLSELIGKVHSCESFGLLSGAYDTMSTPIRIGKQYGGVHLDTLMRDLVFAQGRKMLTLRNGTVADSTKMYDLNPYAIEGKRLILAGDRQFAPVLSRKLMCRGVTDTNLINKLFERISAENKFSQDTHIEPLPLLSQGASCSISCSFPDYPLAVDNNTESHSNMNNCKQLLSHNQFTILDLPNQNSLESIGLKSLVQKCQSCGNCPPDYVTERDIWAELLQSSQTRLLDAYTTDEQ